jgi:hypothetical protein
MNGPAPTPTPFPLTLSAFFARFPEFKATDTTLVQAAMNDAALQIDSSVWNTLAGVGQGYLTAHRLALSPFGQNARMVAKDGKSTTYKTHYDYLVGIVGSGFRVL